MRSQRINPSLMLVMSALTSILLGSALTGCNGQGAATSSVSTDLPSDSTPVVEVPPPKTFAVKPAPTAGMDVYMHQFGDFDKPCEVTSTDSNNVVYCVANAKEYDLYTAGLSFNISVPSDMCAHLVEVPYWYYSRQAGYGVWNEVTLDYNEEDKILNGCSISGTVSAEPSKSAEAGLAKQATPTQCAVGATGFTTPEVIFKPDGTLTCAYDYSSVGGPNCCEGKYRFLVQNKNRAGVLQTTDTLEGEYGGKLSNCASGPAMNVTDWPHRRLDGFPKVLTTMVPAEGINKTFKIAAPMNANTNGYLSNIYIANMFDWAHFPVVASMVLPKGLVDSVDLTGSAIQRPWPTYGFYCLDGAGEVKWDFEVLINEWNSAAELAKYVAPATRATADPNKISTESTSCGYYGSGDACNDFKDWDDFANTYPNTSTGVLRE